MEHTIKIECLWKNTFGKTQLLLEASREYNGKLRNLRDIRRDIRKCNSLLLLVLKRENIAI